MLQAVATLQCEAAKPGRSCSQRKARKQGTRSARFHSTPPFGPDLLPVHRNFVAGAEAADEADGEVVEVRDSVESLHCAAFCN